MNKKIYIILLSIMLAGCLKPVEVNYMEATQVQSDEYGTIQIIFSQPMQRITVIIDGTKIVDNQPTGEIILSKIPTGNRNIEIIGTSSDRGKAVSEKHQIEVKNNETIPIIIQTPELSKDATIAYTSILIASLVVLIFL